MVINKRDTIKNLRKKGFELSANKSDDHVYLEYIHEGKFAFYTKVSHGSTKDIGIPLIKQMAVQCKLDTPEFVDLAKCPMSAEVYKGILATKEILE